MGNDGEGVKERIVAANEKSKVFLEAIKANPGQFEAVRENVRAFVLHRFFLDEEDPKSEDLGELARLSLSKLSQVNKSGVLQDLSNNCAGVSSETMKKALLIMTLQKQLGVRFDPEENDRISQIAHAIVRELG